MFKPRRLQLALAVMLALTAGFAYTRGELDDRIRAAEQGDLTAQYELGRAFLQGEGVERDEPRGVVFLKQAARHADASGDEQLRARAAAAMLLSDHFDRAPDSPGNEGDRIVYLRLAARLGHTAAQVQMARSYLATAAHEQTAPADREIALKVGKKLLEHAGTAGDREAAYELGRLFWDGRLVAKDAARGEEWLQRAAGARHRTAAMLLTSYYLDEPSSNHYGPASGMRYLRLAADAGEARAMLRLAGYLDQGEHTERDATAALEWAKRAQSSGLTQADPLVVRLTSETERLAAMGDATDLPDVLLGNAAPASTDDAFAELELNYALGRDESLSAVSPSQATPLSNAAVAVAKSQSLDFMPAVVVDPASEPRARAQPSENPEFAHESVLTLGEPTPPATPEPSMLKKQIKALLERIDALTQQVSMLAQQLTERDTRIAELEATAKAATRVAAAAPVNGPREDNLTGVAAFRDGRVVEAVQLFERAVRGGDIEAYSNLAVALLQGKGVARDVNRAISLFEQAAELNSGKAAYNLGLINESGSYGLPASPAQARFWFHRAAELGHAAATTRVRSIVQQAPAIAAN